MRRFFWRLGRRIYQNARGDIANAIESNGESLLQKRVLERSLEKEGSCNILDIGANLGLWTQALVDHAKTMNVNSEKLNVYSFEPVPTAREKLILNLENAASQFNIKILPVAMSNETAQKTMVINGETSGSNSLEADKSNSNQAELYNLTVQTQTLEDFSDQENIEIFHLIKCDTEGHDAFVIDGALSLLNQGRIEVFQFEYNHRWIYARRFLKDIFDVIEGLETPYKLGRVTDKHVEIYDKWHPEIDRFFESNYALIREDVIDSLQAYHGSYDASNTYA